MFDFLHIPRVDRAPNPPRGGYGRSFMDEVLKPAGENLGTLTVGFGQGIAEDRLGVSPDSPPLEPIAPPPPPQRGPTQLALIGGGIALVAVTLLIARRV